MTDLKELYRRYSQQANQYARGPFNRYLAEADYYAQLCGLEPKTKKIWRGMRSGMPMRVLR